MRFDLEDNSLFDILIQEYHHIPKKQELTVGIVYADENEAKALNVDKLTALVKKEGITYEINDRIRYSRFCILLQKNAGGI